MHIANELWIMNTWNIAYYTQNKKKHEHPRFHEVIKEVFGDKTPPPKVTKDDVKAQLMRLKRGKT